MNVDRIDLDAYNRVDAVKHILEKPDSEVGVSNSHCSYKQTYPRPEDFDRRALQKMKHRAPADYMNVISPDRSHS